MVRVGSLGARVTRAMEALATPISLGNAATEGKPVRLVAPSHLRDFTHRGQPRMSGIATRAVIPLALTPFEGSAIRTSRSGRSGLPVTVGL
jgi:hypothetical protein